MPVVALVQTSSPGRKGLVGVMVTTLAFTLCVAVTIPCIMLCTAMVWLVTVAAERTAP